MEHNIKVLLKGERIDLRILTDYKDDSENVAYLFNDENMMNELLSDQYDPYFTERVFEEKVKAENNFSLICKIETANPEELKSIREDLGIPQPQVQNNQQSTGASHKEDLDMIREKGLRKWLEHNEAPTKVSKIQSPELAQEDKHQNSKARDVSELKSDILHQDRPLPHTTELRLTKSISSERKNAPVVINAPKKFVLGQNYRAVANQSSSHTLATSSNPKGGVQNSPQTVIKPLPLDSLNAASNFQEEKKKLLKKLDSERARLTELKKEQKKMLQESQKALKESEESLSKTGQAFPSQKITALENQHKLSEDALEGKQAKLNRLQLQLKDFFELKKDLLQKLASENKTILKLEKENSTLKADISEKKKELLKATLASNKILENNLKDIDDSRLAKDIRVAKEVGREPSKSIKVYSSEIKLQESHLPRGWLAGMEEEDVLKLKYLTLIPKGIVYEDQFIKVALKTELNSQMKRIFVMRVINCQEEKKKIDLKFCSNPNWDFAIEGDNKSFTLEGKEEYTFEFRIGKPSYSEIPSVELTSFIESSRAQAVLIPLNPKSSSQTSVTKFALPISALWYHPLKTINEDQFNKLWPHKQDLYFQTEERELDLLVFNPFSLRPTPPHPESEPHQSFPINTNPPHSEPISKALSLHSSPNHHHTHLSNHLVPENTQNLQNPGNPDSLTGPQVSYQNQSHFYLEPKTQSILRVSIAGNCFYIDGKGREKDMRYVCGVANLLLFALSLFKCK